MKIIITIITIILFAASISAYSQNIGDTYERVIETRRCKQVETFEVSEVIKGYVYLQRKKYSFMDYCTDRGHVTFKGKLVKIQLHTFKHEYTLIKERK